MSDFDELFNSIVNDVTVSTLRDSAIILVNEGDSEHPLKTGEYFFDAENNVLYVGVYFPEKFYFWQFIKHDTSVSYIPAPRASASLVTEVPLRTHTSLVVYIPAPRVRVDHSTSIPHVLHASSSRLTNTVHKIYSLVTIVPTVSHSSSVDHI